MKYDQESEEVDFPGYSIQRNDPKSYNNDDEQTSSKKIWIILGIIGILILAGLIVFLILFIKHKRSKNDGGYIVSKYIVKSNKAVTIFNPIYVQLGSEDYQIEIMDSGNLYANSTRILEGEDISIEGNEFTTNKRGIIQLKIIFNKPLTSMTQMFEDCENLIEVDLSNFVSDKITSLSSAFSHCDLLEEVKFDNFKSSNLETMYASFEGCKELKGLDLSSFQETPYLKSMNSLFKNCYKLSYLNLKNFNFQVDVNLREVFLNTNNLKITIVEDSATKTILNRFYKLYFNNNLTDNLNVDCTSGEKENCKECVNENNEKYKCKSCNDGYYLPDIEYPTSCRKCFIDHCNSCSKYVNCDGCRSGFYLSNKTDECLSCSEGCINCVEGNNCLACGENYILNNSICIKNITDEEEEEEEEEEIIPTTVTETSSIKILTDSNTIISSIINPTDSNNIISSTNNPTVSNNITSSVNNPSDSHTITSSLNNSTDSKDITSSIDYPSDYNTITSSIDYPSDSNTITSSIDNPKDSNNIISSINIPTDSN